jgi:hypothetical protein
MIPSRVAKAGQFSNRGGEDEHLTIQQRHFGPIAQLGSDGNVERVDVGALIRRLILFDHCSLVSVRFKELPALIRIFGVHGVLRLLEEPGFEIIDDILVTATVGLNPDLSLPGAERAGKAIDHHVVRSVSLNRDPAKYPDEVMGKVEELGLSSNQSKKLRAELLKNSKQFPLEVSQASMNDFKLTMDQNHDWVLAGLKQVLMDEAGIQEADRLRIETGQSLRFDGAYEVLSNLTSDFGIDELSAHLLVSKTLRGLSSTVQRIRLMQSLDALTGFREDETPFLESRLSALVSPLNPDEHEKTLTRVIELGGWPALDSLDAGVQVDVEKLLAIRNHADCADLRRWFQEVRAKSDTEIIDQFPSVKEKLAFLVHGKTGSRLRVVVTNLADFAPVPYVGKVVSLADKFLFDKFLRNSNPVSLLSRNYPSIFD